MTGQRSLDTYICFGAVDTGWVRVLAGHLFDADITTFLDPWHAGTVDLRAMRVMQGGQQSRCVVLVAGPDTDLNSVPAMVDPAGGPPHVIACHGDARSDAIADRMPSGWALVDFRGADATSYRQRVADLVRIIGPPPDAQRRPGSSCGSALLRVGGERVECTVDHNPTDHDPTDDDPTDDDPADPAADITVDWHRFNALLSSRQRREPEALRAIGTALGATFTPDPVGRTIEDAASAAYAAGGTLAIAVAADGELGELPWETLILPGHDQPLALHPATRVYRTQGYADADATPTPGPLRIVAALACPDSLVDYERVLAGLLDSVEPARKYHGARVRVLTEGTAAVIQEALTEPCHVLHLSCHARPGALLLADGAEVTPEFAAAVGSRVGMVVLSGVWTAHTAPGIEALSAIARALLAAGVAQVLVMSAPATDRYATALFASVYRDLALASVPEALAALAHARRDGERRRLDEVARTGRAVPAQWATPTLYHRGRPGPLYDPGTVAPDPPPAAPGLVGRRNDLRRLLAVLGQPDRPAVLLHGMAGVGKSVLAAEAVRRRGPDAGTVVSLSGALNADRVLTAIGRATGSAALADSSKDLADRLDALAGAPVVLLLDGIDANLVRVGKGSAYAPAAATADRTQAVGKGSAYAPGAATADRTQAVGDDQWTLADPRLAEVLTRLADLAARGTGGLVMTGRHSFDLPDGAYVWSQHVGPLSWPEARLLMWRLPALDRLSLADQNTCYVDSGGHPGTLELLDTLLRRPGASFADLRTRMERLLLDRKIDRPDLWMAQVGRHGVDASLAEAVTSAVYPGLQADAAQPAH